MINENAVRVYYDESIYLKGDFYTRFQNILTVNLADELLLKRNNIVPNKPIVGAASRNMAFGKPSYMQSLDERDVLTVVSVNHYSTNANIVVYTYKPYMYMERHAIVSSIKMPPPIKVIVHASDNVLKKLETSITFDRYDKDFMYTVSDVLTIPNMIIMLKSFYFEMYEKINSSNSTDDDQLYITYDLYNVVFSYLKNELCFTIGNTHEMSCYNNNTKDSSNENKEHYKDYVPVPLQESLLNISSDTPCFF